MDRREESPPQEDRGGIPGKRDVQPIRGSIRRGWMGAFLLEKHARMEVYNDINGNLVNLFRCVKYHSDAVRQELQYILMSREQFFDAVEQAETRGMTDIQRAARFFILIKESFGTDLRSFGVRPRNFEKAKEYLDEVARRLDRVVIERLDFSMS